MNKKRIVSRLKCISALILLLVIAGCKPVGPDYQSPDPNTSLQWQATMQNGLQDQAPDPNALAGWWRGFNDPILTQLIDRAVAGNQNLKSAYSRVLQARAVLSLDSSELYPRFDLGGSGQWMRTNELNTLTRRVERVNRETYSTGIDSRWEIDVFGGVRRTLEAARADLDMSRAQLYDVLVSLSAEVAVNYIQARQYQAQIDAVKQSLELQQESYEMTSWRSEAGLGDELSVNQALYNLENSRSQLPALNSAFVLTCNRIAVLLGEKPGSIQEEMSEHKPVPGLPGTVAVGVPADIIRRRPDIRRAEAAFAVQTARIGVATADLYPKFFLTGSITASASTFHQMGENVGDHSQWYIQGGPQVSWNIFDAGAVRQNIKIQSLQQEQALLNYEKAVLLAQEEVENLLTAYADEQERHINLANAVEAAREAADIASKEYESGLAEFGSVLESQRVLLSFENQLVQSDGTMAVNLVRLYKALGGGWDSQMYTANESVINSLNVEVNNNGK